MEASEPDLGAAMAETAAALFRQAPGDTGAAASFASPAAEAAPAPPSLHKRWSPEDFHWDSSALTATHKPPRLDPEGAAERRTAGAAGATGSPQVKPEAEEAVTGAGPLPEWPDAQSPPLLSPRGGKAPPACQVCGVDVSQGLKDYYARYKICPQHCTMPCIVRNGEHLRFCQQASWAGGSPCF